MRRYYGFQGILSDLRLVEKIDIADKYIAEIGRRLKEKGGDRAAINITEVLKSDIDGDGKDEIFITANSKRDENHEPVNNEIVPGDFSKGKTIAEGQVLYSVILMEKDGVYYDIYQRYLAQGCMIILIYTFMQL